MPDSTNSPTLTSAIALLGRKTLTAPKVRSPTIFSHRPLIIYFYHQVDNKTLKALHEIDKDIALTEGFREYYAKTSRELEMLRVACDKANPKKHIDRAEWIEYLRQQEASCIPAIEGYNKKKGKILFELGIGRGGFLA